jgi:hypothetical protein
VPRGLLITDHVGGRTSPGGERELGEVRHVDARDEVGPVARYPVFPANDPDVEAAIWTVDRGAPQDGGADCPVCLFRREETAAALVQGDWKRRFIVHQPAIAEHAGARDVDDGMRRAEDPRHAPVSRGIRLKSDDDVGPAIHFAPDALIERRRGDDLESLRAQLSRALLRAHGGDGWKPARASQPRDESAGIAAPEDEDA